MKVETRSRTWSARASFVVKSGLATFADSASVRSPCGLATASRKPASSSAGSKVTPGLAGTTCGRSADQRHGGVDRGTLGDLGADDLGQGGAVEGGHQLTVGRRER